MTLNISSAIAAFGARAKEKLSNPAATGQPEDQLRAPFEYLLADLAELSRLPRSSVASVGESSLSDLKTRPDYAVTVRNALVGFVELKAPGKGADPRKFKDPHDKTQWEKLRSLPNLIYTDGNGFSLWQNGELVGSVIKLIGDIESSGDKLEAPAGILNLFESFLNWEPVPPRSARDLAHTTARLCRLLRDEVTEQLGLGSEALTGLATDWRKLLFPDATDERFADGYAQAVTFGMLMARAKKIELATGLQRVARELSQTSSLIGAALKLLTDDAEQATLKTSLGTLTRVLDAVDWSKIGKDRPDSWLYFYEEFLEVYDNELRKQTGSYYTPPEVVGAMVGLVDEALRTTRFRLHAGLASPSVTLADPAVGTGTFILGVLRRIAETVKADEGEGSVNGAINAAVKRLIAFEMQMGPFAVAQLRILAEIVDLTGGPPATPVRMFVTDTLGNPHDDEGWIPGILAPIAKSRKEANKIKREEPITVVIGNPPYKEKAMGRGGWIESGDKNAKETPPLEDWMPPREWGAGAHSKHLRNLYVYFWRWATWKVYDHDATNKSGIVCFITVAGFLNGPGFQKMRDYLRRTCDDIWVVDCSPEGHQPEVNTRIFQGVQQPVCIVLASRSSIAPKESKTPAKVLFQALPSGHRQEKFKSLAALRIKSDAWVECPSDWRGPFLPASHGAWATYPKLDDLFTYNGSGVMPGRTWVIAPDPDSLERRWQKLVRAPADEKEVLFHPHLRGGKPGDKHSNRVVASPLHGYERRPKPIADERGPCLPPARYGFRSFDRQWIIPDNRLINQPNSELWESRSDEQVYLTAPSDRSPTTGPAVTFSALIPDLHHYNGRGGRVFPLWSDQQAFSPNLPRRLLAFLSQKYGTQVTAADFVAYMAGITAHPAFTARFQEDLSTPGLRIPLTVDSETFAKVADLGREVIWLHTFGERMIDPQKGRLAQPPRLPPSRMPRIPAAGAISQEPAAMPDSIGYDATKKRLLVGQGYVENVEPGTWLYEVSGKQVLLQWFSYRKANRDRPIIGDRRTPSPLGNIQPDHWLAEYTTELINVLNVLGRLIDLEPAQAALLEKVCAGSTISSEELRTAGAFEAPNEPRRKALKSAAAPGLFDSMGV
ncbi:MAG TPA: type ISP restriction/modification enzyme [Bryobacteraceae bacterium]|nr:type ISP restriction/modification enzyme [Bryobacteraceae bacterium]